MTRPAQAPPAPDKTEKSARHLFAFYGIVVYFRMRHQKTYWRQKGSNPQGGSLAFNTA
jgi:hypothetical protein